MSNNTTSLAMIIELSAKIKKYRIDYPLTQKELAEKTGVSLRSISRFENGEDIQLSNFIKILSALDLEDNISLLVPDYTKRPSFYLREEKVRKRASSKKGRRDDEKDFKWGDEL